jgi:hypothetical protein
MTNRLAATDFLARIEASTAGGDSRDACHRQRVDDPAVGPAGRSSVVRIASRNPWTLATTFFFRSLKKP